MTCHQSPSLCIFCHHGPCRCGEESDHTLFDPETINLSRLKIEDDKAPRQARVMFAVPASASSDWGEPQPQQRAFSVEKLSHYRPHSPAESPHPRHCSSAEPQPQPTPRSFTEQAAQARPCSSTESPPQHRSCSSTEPSPQHRSCSFTEQQARHTPNFFAEQQPRHTPSFFAEQRPELNLDPFPGPWPQDWDRHPTIPGLLWMCRPWSDGSVEYLLHRLDMEETRTFWLPAGGDMFDFTQDPWTDAQLQSTRSARPLASPAVLSDSSGETALGETSERSHFGWGFSRAASAGIGLGIGMGSSSSTPRQVVQHAAVIRRTRGEEREARKREKAAEKMRAEEEKRERRRKRREREEARKKRGRLYMVAEKGRKVVYVTTADNIWRRR